MDILKSIFEKYLTIGSLPTRITPIDILEILIIAFVLYHIIIWVKQTRAWIVVKGLIVILFVILIAVILEMRAILWIFENSIQIIITALIVVFQPELRKALEQLGRKNYIASLIPFEDTKGKEQKYSERTVNEIVKAAYEMGKSKTGALIVMEREVALNEFERTGIALDSLVSSQLLINIFEHNTPLHDGAVIVRGDRITAATCYLPLSDNMELSKELGTRHRAAVGISEVTDSITVIVSEETGKVSIALEGEIIRAVDGETLKKYLLAAENDTKPVKRKIKLWKGRRKDERTSDK
ncbi:diadenylate cyclase CdaA [Acetivibrio ethanolgignens]|uniref:diadenylate cyclase CdaA n=1 Tax=Acetivibrio ethanolgignens TaxID=290052 RepID=UPI000ABFFCD7|nr:diadenylate cyclase CdaA [Acetivibrio ethanolgignens]